MLHLVESHNGTATWGGNLVYFGFGMAAFLGQELGGTGHSLGDDSACHIGVKSDLDAALDHAKDEAHHIHNAARTQYGGGVHQSFIDHHGLSNGIKQSGHGRLVRSCASQAGHGFAHVRAGVGHGTVDFHAFGHPAGDGCRGYARNDRNHCLPRLQTTGKAAHNSLNVLRLDGHHNQICTVHSVHI